MKRALLPIALLMSVATAVPAFAETAEEAVGYVFLGLADGGAITRGNTTMNWKESANSPAVFDGDTTLKGKAAKLKFTVKANDPCNYEIVLEGPPQMIPGGKRLYAKVMLDQVAHVTPSSDGNTVAIDGKGFCQTSAVRPDCAPDVNTDLLARIDAKHHAEEVTFLAGICPAKPTP